MIRSKGSSTGEISSTRSPGLHISFNSSIILRISSALIGLFFINPCVISYWVLSGAKRRQIQQLRCCVLPTKLLKRRNVYLKLTRHNGRAGTHGTYNPKHNDRSFDLANSEHIDPERAKGNIYWDCFHGFRSALDPQDPDDLAATFSEVERQFYESRYSNFVESQNEILCFSCQGSRLRADRCHLFKDS